MALDEFREYQGVQTDLRQIKMDKAKHTVLTKRECVLCTDTYVFRIIGDIMFLGLSATLFHVSLPQTVIS